MAFGGVFNPNYQFLPPASPQNPMQQQPGSATQMGYGASNPMAMYSLYGLLGSQQKGGMQSSPTQPTNPNNPTFPPKPPASPQVPQVPQVPVPPPPPPNSGGAPSSGSSPVGGGSPGSGSVPGAGTTPPPPSYTDIEVPDIGTYPGSPYDQAVAQYNSPEYAAYYNALPPSTRAFMHPPGNPEAATYLGTQWQNNVNAWNGRPPF